MNGKRLLLLAGVLVVVGVPVAAKWARRDAQPRCALDGLKVEPLYRVRIVDRAGRSHPLCCVRCATVWLARQPERPQAIYATDETTSAEIDARSAWLVQSAVVTNAITGNRVHVFAAQSDAERHIGAYGGAVLTGTERPF